MESKIFKYGKYIYTKITCFRTQILLHEDKVEQIEVHSKLLFTFVTHRNIRLEHLHFPNIFSYFFHNYDQVDFAEFAEPAESAGKL